MNYEYIQTELWPLVKHVYIIAELGINHNGDLDIVKEMIQSAKINGADAVKFQKRTIDVVYTKEFLDSPRESPWGTTQRHQKEGLELTREDYNEIDKYCRELKIDWFASAWDLESQRFLRQYDLPHNKIASPMLTHWNLLHEVAAEGKHTFISTGMSTYEDIDKAVEIFGKYDCHFTLLHCVSEYPAHETVLNLLNIQTLRERYKVPVGYSGHESTMLPGVIAVMLGAVAVERHITLDRAMYGTDQAASLEGRGFGLMTGYIRTIPAILGSGQKTITAKEHEVCKKLRYYIGKYYV